MWRRNFGGRWGGGESFLRGHENAIVNERFRDLAEVATKMGFTAGRVDLNEAKFVDFCGNRGPKNRRSGFYRAFHYLRSCS